MVCQQRRKGLDLFSLNSVSALHVGNRMAGWVHHWSEPVVFSSQYTGIHLFQGST